MRPEELLQLIRKLVADDPQRRARGADELTDWIRLYTSTDGRILTGVLAIAAACESDAIALEAQLNAIIQLGDLADDDAVSYVRSLESESLPPGLSDYVDDILNG
ncbi:hypothetical protein [Streptomyces sp. NPDC002054]|uniref:hypothetical protein n=1 Tax=Streptomyces sp. NPDC002054 TaxID=3154663 RepID=UPI00332C66DF